ncbi:hypothetical protein [Enterococcus durans]|uniref:hypothetical protein n=1 Tax=Enterococcus durans TaxID=53345 RepID=UPI002157F082|nr:hypothetical protein [Enterococcus durans]
MKKEIWQYIKSNNKEVELMLGKVANLKSIGEGGNGLVYSGELLEKGIALKILGELSQESKKIGLKRNSLTLCCSRQINLLYNIMIMMN